MTVLLAVLFGCAPDIHAAYEADRAAATRVLSEAAPAGWEPSLRMQVPFATLQPVVERAADAAVRGLADLRVSPGLGVELSAHPDLRVRGLKLEAAACRPAGGQAAPERRAAGIASGAQCLRVEAAVDGSVAMNALGAVRTVPVSGSFVAQAGFVVEDGLVVRMFPERVERVTLAAAGQFARVDLSPVLEDALAHALVQEASRITVADLREGMPLRAVRVSVATQGVEIGALGDASGVEAVSEGAFPEAGLRVRVAPSLVLALARRAAFESGPMAMDIVADPRGMDLAGQDLTVDLRLWRLTGRGWWRDYTVKADVAVRDARLAITAHDASLVEASPRAGLADPLAALVQSRVLTALEDALTRSVSVGRKASAAGLSIAARMTSLHGEEGVWVADAALVVREASR